MSIAADPQTSESRRAEAGTVRFVLGAGLIAALHLAALAVLWTTEYGPFAIALSLLAWAFVNCLLLAVLPRPGICAALALALTVLLIALSRFKFDILQLSLTFLDFLIKVVVTTGISMLLIFTVELLFPRKLKFRTNTA